MKKALLSIISLVFLLSACFLPVNTVTLHGSGTIVSETRSLKSIDRVELAAPGELRLVQGEQEELVLSAEENILPHLITHVQGSTLRIYTEENYHLLPSRKVTYLLKVKNISSLSVSSSGSISADKLNSQKLALSISSSGDIRIDSLTASDLTVRISSSGNLALTGQVVSQDIRISSSGSYLADGLQSQSAYVNISSSGNARIWVTTDLAVQLSSSGNVEYYGNPKVASKTSSSGRVNFLGEHP